MSRRGFLLVGLLVSLLLAGVVSTWAATSPDGLEYATRQGCQVDDQGRVDGGDCIARAEQEHALSEWPLADYVWRGLDGPLGTGLAGATGVLLAFGLGWGLLRLARGRGPADGHGAPDPAAGPGDADPAAGHGAADPARDG